MKRWIKIITKEFSGFLSLFIVGGIAFILSGDLGGLFNWIWNFKWLVGPLAIMIILVPFWPKIKGAFGEHLVRNKLSKLDPTRYKTHNNVFLKLKAGKTSQIDHVVISTFGLFVIETKNYSGWISGEERSEYWTQFFFRSKKRFLNPIWQNNGHVKALKEVLNDFGEISYIPIVVFSNKANLKRVNSEKVIFLNELTGFMRAKQEQVIDENTLVSIHARLQEVAIKDNKEVKKHIENIKSKVEEKSHVCPRCGSPLVQRNGRYGPFMGCSGFPKCRYIYKGQ